MRNAMQMSPAARAALALALAGCSSVVGVRGGAPGSTVVVTPAPDPGNDHACRTEPLGGDLPAEPATRRFRPGANDVLRDLKAWDAASSKERLDRARALLPQLRGFTLVGLQTFSSGSLTHEVAVYADAPTGLEFVLVPCAPRADDGTFAAIEEPFLVARNELTRDDWRREMCPERGAGDPDGRVAVGGLTFDEARRFVENCGFDLPSLAQWEVACRAGSSSRFCFGGDSSAYAEYAWSAADAKGGLHPVGLRRPNAFGLFDVHGNVREWCRGAFGSHGERFALGEGADGGPDGPGGEWLLVEKGGSRWTTGLRPVFTIAAPEVDDAGDDVALRLTAVGVQTYRCVASDEGVLSWKFVGPTADLYDADGRAAGHHFLGDGGPVWEVSDGRVTGKKVSERPSPNAGSIPELGLAVPPNGASGTLARVTRIERLGTVGGSAPDVAGRQPGDEVSVPYTARYVFHASR